MTVVVDTFDVDNVPTPSPLPTPSAEDLARATSIVDGARSATVLLVDEDGDPWSLDEFAVEVAVRLGYSEDQSRDESGRFGEGGGGVSPVHSNPGTTKGGKEQATISAEATLSAFPEAFQNQLVERSMELTGSTPKEMEDRLLASAERASPETVAAGAVWYQNAHDFVVGQNTASDGSRILDPEVANAVIAASSPGQSWESNQEITTAILAAAENGDYRITQEEADKANSVTLRDGPLPRLEAGMTLREIMAMTDPKPGMAGAVLIARSTGISPGKTGYAPFAKSVDIASRNDPSSIGRDLVGEKVRSFFNTISDPRTARDVVVDVHGMQTMVYDHPPVGRDAAIRLRNVADNSSAFNSPTSGRASVGTYPVMADAMRNASSRYNDAHGTSFTPAQFQAITWTQQAKVDAPVVDRAFAPRSLGLPWGDRAQNTERSQLVRVEMAQQVATRWPDGVAIARKGL